MNKKIMLCGLLLFGSSACEKFPSISSDTTKQFESRIGGDRMPGAVVAVFNGDKVVYRSFGSLGTEAGKKPNEHSIYEIASITKVFTSLLLADMVVKGEVALEDPAEKWIVPAIRTPRQDGATFTLLDLSTHRSGLIAGVFFGPLGDADGAELMKFVKTTGLNDKPGQSFAYSNAGVDVLGRALADKAKADFGSLLEQRVLGPLGLSETSFKLSPAIAGRYAKGFADGRELAPLELDASRPAAGLKSSASDLVRLMKLEMGQLESPLRKAMDLTLESRPGREPMALGWFTYPGVKGPSFWHSGRVDGTRSWAAFRPSDGRGVVILSSSTADLGDLVFQLMDPEDLGKEDWTSTVAMTDEEMARFAGRYKFREGAIVFNARPGGLAAQIQGRSDVLDLVPQNAFEFINAEQKVRVRFKMEPDGKINGFEVEQAGEKSPINPRIE